MLAATQPLNILVSAGEASGDMYAAGLVRELQRRHPQAAFFGCAGPELRAAGVEAVVRSESLSVVGLVEVIHHIPRIYGEFRKLKAAARRRKPDLAILADSPDFHLRLAAYLKKLGIPVLYLVAPQVWAWRKGRIRTIRRNVDRLACIFPFEEKFFRNHQVPADYIGHPLTRAVKTSLSKSDFCEKFGIPRDRRLIALLPGSRAGEIARHLSPLAEAVDLLRREEDVAFVLATPSGFSAKFGNAFFKDRLGDLPIQVVEGWTRDVIGHAEIALAASGTVTIETAILGTPMVTFYKVSGLSWALGRALVDVPFLSMVNLVAGRRVIVELIQTDCSGRALADEALRLLRDPMAREQMKQDLANVAGALAGEHDPMERAADIAEQLLNS